VVVSILSGAVAAAASPPDINLWPRSQWYGSTFTGLARGSKQLASPTTMVPTTAHFTLARNSGEHNVKPLCSDRKLCASARRYRPPTGRSWSYDRQSTSTHALLTLKSREIRRQLSDCRAALSDAIVSIRISSAAIRGRRPASSHCSPTTSRTHHVERDWLRLGRASAEIIRAQSSKQIRGGDVILLHDGDHRQMGGTAPKPCSQQTA